VGRPKNTSSNDDEMIPNDVEFNNKNEDIHDNNEEIRHDNEDMIIDDPSMAINEELNNSVHLSQENESRPDEDIVVDYETVNGDADSANVSNAFSEPSVDVSVSIACGSEVIADHWNSCSERSDATTETESYTGRISNSSKLVVPGMLSLVATERRCCICGGKGRSRVPLTVVVDTWMTKQVFIPPSNRCCKDHLDNGKLQKNIVLRPQKKDAEISGTQLSKLMHGIASYFAKNKRTLDFDCVNYDDQVYHMLLGVSKQNFEQLFKVTSKEMRNSKNRYEKSKIFILNMNDRIFILCTGLLGMPWRCSL